MCQAYEAEANAIRWSEHMDRVRDHKRRGRIARQNNEPQKNWSKLVYEVKWKAEDHEMHSVHYWKNHSWDGPLINAWIEGWKDENKRIKAGGCPLTPEERKDIAEKISKIRTYFYSNDIEKYKNRVSGVPVSGNLLIFLYEQNAFDLSELQKEQNKSYEEIKNSNWYIQQDQILDLFNDPCKAYCEVTSS